MEEFL